MAAQGIYHKPGHLGVLLISGHKAFRSIVISVIPNSPGPEHHIRLDFSEFQDGFPQSGPDGRSKPHIQADHIDLSIIGQQLHQLVAVPFHHPVNLFGCRVICHYRTYITPVVAVLRFQVGSPDRQRIGGRNLQWMPYIRPEISIIPVGMRKIEVNLNAPLAGGIGEFLNDIPSERCFHDAVGQVARFNGRPAGSGIVYPPDHPGFGVKHGKSLMVLGGKGKHFHTGIGEQIHPFIRIKSLRIPGFIQFVVRLFFLVGKGEIGP